MAKQPTNKDIKAAIGEKTKKQMASFTDALFGYTRARPGTMAVYRYMRQNPTVALARAVSTAPLRAVRWGLEVEEHVPGEAKEFIESQMKRHWDQLINDILFSQDFGFQAFEKVFELVDDAAGQMRIGIKKFKALNPDITKVVVDQDTGSFKGLEQGKVQLTPEKCLWYVYDGEPGEWYGRSKHENIRENAWHPWCMIMRKQIQYINKVAGVIPIVKYPVGDSTDAAGSEKSNFEIASAVLQNLGQGNGVAMPQEFLEWAQDLARRGVDPAAFSSWKIDFLEAKGDHTDGFTASMKHYEALMLRGWLVPERAAIEGQYGTKAEAETHGDLGMLMAKLEFQNILRFINEYVIDQLVLFNYPDLAPGDIKLKNDAMDPDLIKFFRTLMEKVLSAPSNVNLLQTWTDIDAMFDILGIPKAVDTIEIDEDDLTDDVPPEDEEEDGDEEDDVIKEASLILNRMNA